MILTFLLYSEERIRLSADAIRTPLLSGKTFPVSVILVSLFYCRCLCCYDSSFFLVVGTGFSSVRVKNRCVQANLTLGFEVPILLLANILQCLANNEILIMSNACHVRNTEKAWGILKWYINELKIGEYKDLFKWED